MSALLKLTKLPTELHWCQSLSCFWNFFSSHQNTAVAKAESEQKIQRWASKGGKDSQAAGLCCHVCRPTADWSRENEAVTIWEGRLWHDPQREDHQRPDAGTKGWFLWAARRDRAGQLLYGQAGRPRLDQRSGTVCFCWYWSMFYSLHLT